MPEAPCFRARIPLVWEETDAAPDVGAEPEVDRREAPSGVQISLRVVTRR